MLSQVHSKIDLEWLNLGYSRRNFYNSFFYFTRKEEIAKVLTNKLTSQISSQDDDVSHNANFFVHVFV